LDAIITPLRQQRWSATGPAHRPTVAIGAAVEKGERP
jgi:hypothetical protein